MFLQSAFVLLERNLFILSERFGTYRNYLKLSEEQRKRITTSKKCQCPFSIFGKLKNSIWTFETRNASHNHGKANPTQHPSHRRLCPTIINAIDQMFAAGSPNRVIRSVIRLQFPDSLLNEQDLRNLRKKNRKSYLNGRSPIEALLDELKNGPYMFDLIKNENDRLTHLFFIHNRSVRLLELYSTMLMMDCTYKTNRYRFPLLNIIGITACNKPFFSAFIFLKDETRESYLWALTKLRSILKVFPRVIITDKEKALISAIETIFPNSKRMLCLWHIEKNLLTNVKAEFQDKVTWEIFMNSWKSVLRSPTISVYEANLEKLRETFAQKPRVLAYIEANWIPHKENFVHAWIDQFLHLGHR